MPEHREYTISFATDDYCCREGVDLEIEDILNEVTALRQVCPDQPLPDMVVWESDRIRAIVRFPNGPGQPPSIVRFDRSFNNNDVFR